MRQPPIFFMGSLPHSTPAEAIEFVKKYSNHLPFLPQLPETNPQEDMIGQVLRGIELGYWDEKASSCLELFQNEFVDAERFKIQIAGPYTVARSLSTKFVDLAPQWVTFWRGLRKQLNEASFQGELWLQIDEPFWSLDKDLPDGYTAFLQAVKEVGGKIKMGIHSCASKRPPLFPDHVKILDFFAFDFSNEEMSSSEVALWTHLLGNDGKTLVYGGLSGQQDLKLPILAQSPQFWVSSPCGFYGWDTNELELAIKRWDRS